MRNFKRLLSMMLALAMLMVWMPTVGVASEGDAKLTANEQLGEGEQPAEKQAEEAEQPTENTPEEGAESETPAEDAEADKTDTNEEETVVPDTTEGKPGVPDTTEEKPVETSNEEEATEPEGNTPPEETTAPVTEEQEAEETTTSTATQAQQQQTAPVAEAEATTTATDAQTQEPGALEEAEETTPAANEEITVEEHSVSIELDESKKSFAYGHAPELDTDDITVKIDGVVATMENGNKTIAYKYNSDNINLADIQKLEAETVGLAVEISAAGEFKATVEGAEVSVKIESNSLNASTGITITKQPITLNTTASNHEEIYNGTAQPYDSFEVTCDGEAPANGETAKLIATGTDVGEYTADFKIVDSAGDDKTRNYTITTTSTMPKLIITTLPVTVEQVTDSTQYPISVTYDGKKHYALFKVTSTLPTGFTVDEATMLSSNYQEEVGTYTGDTGLLFDTTAIVIKDSSGNPVSSGNFNINAQKASLTIEKRNIEVKVDKSAAGYDSDKGQFIFTYDGQPHNAVFKVEGLPAGNDNVLVVDPTTLKSDNRTDANTYESLKLTVDGLVIKAGETAVDKTKNFNITIDEAVDLVIEPLKITFAEDTSDSDIYKDGEFVYTYDGTEKYAIYKVASTLPSADYKVLQEDSETLKSEGTIPATTGTYLNLALDTLTLMNDSSPVASGNYTFVAPAAATVVINKREVKIKADSDHKSYDGKPLTKESYTIISDDGIASVDALTVAYGSSVTTVEEGTVANEISKVQINDEEEKAPDANGKAEFTNYIITVEDGELYITQYAVTLKQIDKTKTAVYDGKQHFAEFEIDKGENWPEDHTVVETSLTTKIGPTEVADNNIEGKSIKMACPLVIQDKHGNDVTTSFTINYSDPDMGVVTITPREVSIRGADDKKVYDATELKLAKYEVTSGALVEGEAFKVEMTSASTITDVGTKPNTIAKVKMDGADEFVEVEDVTEEVDGEEVTSTVAKLPNYTVTISGPGTLEITPKPVTITASDATKIYDGTELVQPEFTNTALTSADTHVFDVKMTEASTITKVGEVKNVIATVDGTKVETGKATVVGNYLVTPVEGKLVVTPRTIKRLHLEQVEGNVPYRFLLEVELDESDGVKLDEVKYGDLSITFTDGRGNTYTGFVFTDEGKWVGEIGSFRGEDFHNVTIQASLGAKVDGNFTVGGEAAKSEVVTADFKAMDATATFRNRDQQANVEFHDSVASGNLIIGTSNSALPSKISESDGGKMQVNVTWSGTSLISSGTEIRGTYLDKYGNEGSITGKVERSPAKADITLRLNNTTFNRNNRLVTVSGTAWGYETITIQVTGAGGATETYTVGGTGAWETTGSGPYNWVFTPRIGEDGEYTITVSYDDLIGGSATQTFTVDTAVKPNVVTLKPYDYASYAVVAGVTEPNSSVSLSINDTVLASGKADSHGYYRLIGEVPNDPNSEALIGRVDRTNYLVLTITDEAGNTERVVFDQFTHSNEDYSVRVVGLGGWIVDEADNENWAMATKLEAGVTTVPLLLGGVYKVGEMQVSRTGNTVTATYSLDENIVKDDLVKSLNEQMLVFEGLPTLDEVKNGASDSKAVATLANGGSVTLEVAADAELYLVTNIDLQVSDVDEMLYQVANQPFDFSASPLYVG